MMPLTVPVKPIVKVRLRVYHCGNFLGVWGDGAEWWCRTCHRLIDSVEVLAQQ